MTVRHGLRSGTADEEHLLELAAAFPRIQVVRVPRRSIFSNESSVKACQSQRCPVFGDARSHQFTYSKIAAFGLIKWSRVLLLDTDVLVIRPLDRLWRLAPLNGKQLIAAAPALMGRNRGPFCESTAGGHEEPFGGALPGARKFSTAVMLVRPSLALARVVTTLLRHARDTLPDKLKRNCNAGNLLREQAFLNRLFGVDAALRVRCLPQN
eukprot:3316638-Prymnesium_polylepis.1